MRVGPGAPRQRRRPTAAGLLSPAPPLFLRAAERASGSNLILRGAARCPAENVTRRGTAVRSAASSRAHVGQRRPGWRARILGSRKRPISGVGRPGAARLLCHEWDRLPTPDEVAELDDMRSLTLARPVRPQRFYSLEKQQSFRQVCRRGRLRTALITDQAARQIARAAWVSGPDWTRRGRDPFRSAEPWSRP
jgi:hypothetical protein